MAIEDLEKKIYKPGGREEVEKERGFQVIKRLTENKEHIQYNPESFRPPGQSILEKYKRYFVGLLLIFLTILGVFLIYRALLWFEDFRFNQENVEINIKTEKNVVSGQEISMFVQYSNYNFSTLRNVTLEIDLPDSLLEYSITPSETNKGSFDKSSLSEGERLIFDLGDLSARQSVGFEIKGRMIAEKSSLNYTVFTLQYVSKNSETFVKTDEYGHTIVDSPILIDINAPLRASSGDQVEYLVAISNSGNFEFLNAEIQLSYPKGFILEYTNTSPTRNDNIFVYDAIKSRETKEILIRGRLYGDESEYKVLKATLGIYVEEAFAIYAQSQSSTEMQKPYISLSQVVTNQSNGSVTEGSNVNYTVKFKNNTSLRISENILTVAFEDDHLDLSGLSAEGADFDLQNKKFIWKGAQTPALKLLAPNQEGEVNFSLSLKNRLPIEDFQDKNLTLKTTAFFESNEIPSELQANKVIQTNVLETKIDSKLILEAQVWYKGDTTYFTNTGPFPPVIGIPTTYSVYLDVRNLFNDLENVELTAFLPENVQWVGQADQNKIGVLKYNERTKELTWSIPKLPAHVGILTPAYRLAFQVELNPVPNQPINSYELISNTKIVGKDTFTNSILSSVISSIGTIRADDGKIIK